MAAVWVIALALLWVALVAFVVAALLAAGLPVERPAPADPYASDVAEFNAELSDWDRRGRP